ncbi:MAG: Flp family type IVb pilin [Gemmatimonadota bacterium]|nr:Flp family type IVb pilin [Gemmatimonadota bacterium]
MQINTTLKRFLADESGASMAEYALLLGVIVVALVTALGAFKDKIAGAFNAAGNNIN